MQKQKRMKKMKSKSSFPDLTGDGKVTQKDILRGKGVEGFAEGGSINMNSSDIPQRKRMAMGAKVNGMSLPTNKMPKGD